MSMNGTYSTALVMALVLGLGVGGVRAAADEPSPVPDLAWRDRTTGARVELADFAGQVVVLDYFAYWCGPCRPASRTIEREITREYAQRVVEAGDAPVTVLAVNIESAQPARTAAFVEAAGLSRVVNDVGGETLAALGARGLPFLVVLDGTGAVDGNGWRVVYQHSGFEGSARLRAVIEAARAGKETR